MNLENLLIIEDNEAQIDVAKRQLGEGFFIVRNFKEFESTLEEHGDSIQGILSDLYFPNGNSSKYLEHKTETLEILDRFINGTLVMDSNNPIVAALEFLVEEGFANTYEEVVDRLQEEDLESKKIYEYVRETLKIDEKSMAYKKLRSDISNGTRLLPEGIFVYKEAQKKNLPCIIVTDSYHHGPDFEPFRNSVGKYFDCLINGEKEWKKAYAELVK